MDKIKKDIEKLREELNILLNDNDRYNDGKILEISQKLDTIICEYIKHKDE